MTRWETTLRATKMAPWAVTLTLALGALMAPAASGELAGPVIGNVKYASTISPADQYGPDSDAYVGVMLTGGKLRATVVAAKSANPLLPDLEVIAPDGTTYPVKLSVKKSGRSVGTPNLKVGQTGPWSVRISGKNSTSGDYKLALSVQSKPQKGRDKNMLTATDTVETHTFDAIGGSRVDLELRLPKGSLPMDIVAVRAPDGSALTVPATKWSNARKGRVSFTTPAQYGAYEVDVAFDGAQTLRDNKYELRSTVKPPKVTKIKNAVPLSPVEPRLQPLAEPISAEAGDTITLSGTNFSTDGGLSVKIGTSPAPVTQVDKTTIQCTVPNCSNGGTVPVTVVNTDGQATQAPSYVAYVAPSSGGSGGGTTGGGSGSGSNTGGGSGSGSGSGGATNPPPAVTAKNLVPGNGFTKATKQPSAIGWGNGSNAKAIARWDVVPFQRFSSKFTIGVVAFHVKGIDRVEFCADGGTWIKATAMTPNARTGVCEYMVELDPADWTPGETEIRAVVYPTVGIPRVLGGPIDGGTLDTGEHSLFLHADPNGNLARQIRYADAKNGSDATGDGTKSKPFKSIYQALTDIQLDAGKTVVDACDGAIVYCKPGTYMWGPGTSPRPSTSREWATIMPAPGVARSQVVIDRASTSGGLRVKHVHAKGVTIRGDWTIPSHDKIKDFLWVDNCDMDGPGRTAGRTPILMGHWTGYWVTDTQAAHYRRALEGAVIVRNTHVSDLSADAYGDSMTVLNCTVDGIDASGTVDHPDVYQFSGTGQSKENFVIFGLRATDCESQGIFSDDLLQLKDVAFVNVLISRPAGVNAASPPLSQWIVPTDHFLLINVSLTNSTFTWRVVDTQMSNVRVEGCSFSRMIATKNKAGSTVTVPSVWFESNHYADTTTGAAIAPGGDVSTGDPMFKDPSKDDYAPKSNSPLLSRMNQPIVPVDVLGNQRSSPDTVGAVK